MSSPYLDRPIKARRLHPDEKVQAGDWYKIPCAPTLFRIEPDYPEVGKSWLENNSVWFRYEGFYRLPRS